MARGTTEVAAVRDGAAFAGVEQSRLSYWFPAVRAALPATRYPATEIVRVPDGCDLTVLLDGEEPFGFRTFVADLDEAALRAGGYPTFLRHDLAAAKHEWLETCFVPRQDALAAHVSAAVESWHTVNFFGGGGEDVWAVHEYLPVTPAVMTAFRGTPIGPERRYVVRDGEVADHFPYWPLAALWEPPRDGSGLFEGDDPPVEQPDPTPPAGLMRTLGTISQEPAEEVAELTGLAERVGMTLGGTWTVDFSHTARGWVLVDMAQAAGSWLATDEDRAAWQAAVEMAEKGWLCD